MADPSNPVLCQIADAVVAELNATDFGQTFSAVRVHAPEFKLDELATLHVTVAPKAYSAERLDRSSRQFDYSVDVAVQKKLTTGGNAEIDPLIGLAERIGDHFDAKRLPQFPQAVCLRVESEPIYSPAHMREDRLFTCVLTLVFRMAR